GHRLSRFEGAARAGRARQGCGGSRHRDRSGPAQRRPARALGGRVFGRPGLRLRTKAVRARTPRQAEYLKALEENELVFAIGPAGTGKTYLAVAAAANALRTKKVERIILVRPAVEAGESLGFLPGDMQEKVDPYLRPLYDALQDLMPFEKIRRFLELGVIEIAPLAFMRGRTLTN